MKYFVLLTMAVFCLLLGGGDSTVWGQSPQPPQPQLPAVIDTAMVEITLPEGSAPCVFVAVSNDTLGFGVGGALMLEFGDASFLPLAADLNLSAPWLKISDWQGSSEAGGIIFGVHAYRLNPFQIKVGSVVTPVIHVLGSTSDLSETAAIRMPRSWATRWWILVIAALLLTALIMGLWWLWRRRVSLKPLDQWEPAAPAWLKASIGLRQLLENDYPDLESSRQFLDQLSLITRGYLAGRYLVHAGEMTSGEILLSCQMKGHDNRSLRRLVKILQGMDHQRYNPDPPVVSWCRAQAGEFLDAMAELRIEPRYIHVDAALKLEADKAWSWLLSPENCPLDSTSSVGGDR